MVNREKNMFVCWYLNQITLIRDLNGKTTLTSDRSLDFLLDVISKMADIDRSALYDIGLQPIASTKEVAAVAG